MYPGRVDDKSCLKFSIGEHKRSKAVSDCWVGDKLITVMHNATLTGGHDSLGCRDDRQVLHRVHVWRP